MGTGRNIIVILGPTASGKTAVSFELSKLLEIEVISADSRQIYQYMDIGTAKPTEKELSTVPHYFIDTIDPKEYYSAGIFGDEASCVVDRILDQNKTPVVVGGSGLYIQSLCEGFFSEPETDKEKLLQIREELNKKFQNEGIDSLFIQLQECDPVSAKKYSDKNPRRIQRALEYYKLTGIPLSNALENKSNQRNFNSKYYGIHFEREELYSRINQRTEIMWNDGILEETIKLIKMGFDETCNAMNTVGYKECMEHIIGKISAEEALDKIKQNTRRYAKRQLTWFRKNKSIIWLSGDNIEIAKKIYKDFTNT